MKEQFLQIPITGNDELQQKWIKFSKQLSSNKLKAKGRFIFQTMEYDPNTIDYVCRASWFARKLTINESGKHRRSFLLYLPRQLKNNFRLLVLLHGTNQTIFDSQITIQIDKHGQQRRLGWMQYADDQGFAVLIPQSRGLQYRKRKYYGWQPGTQDLTYLQKILKIITHENYHKHKNMPFFTISPRNIIVLGFSNGGLFTSDLYLKYVSQLNKNVNNFSISIFINYMGGIQPQSCCQTVIKLDEELKRTQMIIISCKRDQNYGPCLRAFNFFEFHKCNVKFIDIGLQKHMFIYQSIQRITDEIENNQENKSNKNSKFISIVGKNQEKSFKQY